MSVLDVLGKGVASFEPDPRITPMQWIRWFRSQMEFDIHGCKVLARHRSEEWEEMDKATAPQEPTQ